MLNAHAHAITFDCKTFVPAAQHHNRSPIYSNSMVVEQSIRVRVQHVMNRASDFGFALIDIILSMMM